VLRPLTSVLGGLALAGGGPAGAGDPETGRLVANMCRTCHELDGHAAIPIAPHVKGEPAAYLGVQLRAYGPGRASSR
jgi:cytochrome c553